MATKLPPLLDCKPFKVIGLTEHGKPFQPKDGQPGARYAWGDECGEIWSLASPRGVFVIPDYRPGVVVHVIDGREIQTFDYRP